MKKHAAFYILFTLLLAVISYAAVPDSDQDGVPDSEDQCLDSGTNVVDQFGCSCAQKNCPNDNNPRTHDCSIIDGLPTCKSTNNNNPCPNGNCYNGICNSNIVREIVRCTFLGSNDTQKCYSNKGNCTGIFWCALNVTGKKGEKVTWKSSCGGYTYTTMDGLFEEVEFDCFNISYNQTNETYIVNETNETLYPNQTNETFPFNETNETFPPVNQTNETQCYDSDGGKNYYVKGTTTFYGKSYEDSCKNSTEGIDNTIHLYEGKYLNEDFCVNENTFSSTNYECPNGCKDGSCLKGDENDKPLPPFDLTVLTATDFEGKLIAKLEWKNVNGEAFYIYKNKNDGDFIFLAKTQDKFYKDTEGLSKDVKYGYYVTAVNNYGESNPSSIVYVYPSSEVENAIKKKPNIFIKIRNFFRRLFS